MAAATALVAGRKRETVQPRILRVETVEGLRPKVHRAGRPPSGTSRVDRPGWISILGRDLLPDSYEAEGSSAKTKKRIELRDSLKQTLFRLGVAGM